METNNTNFNFNFKATAQAQTLLSPIMVGREKLDTEDVLNRDLTIIGFDFAPKFDQNGNPIADENGVPDEFGVVVFKEHPDSYYCVGTVFSKVCKAWAAPFPTVKAASAALEAQGGVKVRFRASKTKKGNNLTTVDILE